VNADGLALPQNFFRLAAVHHLIGAQLAGSSLVEAIHTHVASGSLREVLVAFLITLALADSHLHPTEDALLADIAARLGYDSASYRHLMDMVLNQGHFAAGTPISENALEDAYKALGVTPENTDNEIKRAYCKLMSQYHPDKLTGQGLPDDMIAMATEKTKEIQLAYVLIQKRRAG
jgi:DnaJ like chaperone protein